VKKLLAQVEELHVVHQAQSHTLDVASILTCKDDSLHTPLHAAAYGGDIQVIEAICASAEAVGINFGDLLLSKDINGCTAIMIAVQHKCTDAFGSLLQVASSTEVLKKLVALKAKGDRTLLHLAAQAGGGMVETLTKGLKSHGAENLGAVRGELIPNDKHEQQRQVPEIGTKHVLTSQAPVRSALQPGKPASRVLGARLLPEKTPETHNAAARDASATTAMVVDWLTCRSDASTGEVTPLHLAVTRSSEGPAGECNESATLKALLELGKTHGKLVHMLAISDADGNTPLDTAAARGNIKVVDMLLSAIKSLALQENHDPEIAACPPPNLVKWLAQSVWTRLPDARPSIQQPISRGGTCWSSCWCTRRHKCPTTYWTLCVRPLMARKVSSNNF
jgi:ankyrin repeat protein